MDDNGATGEMRARSLVERRNDQSPEMHIQNRLERICKKLEEMEKWLICRILEMLLVMTSLGAQNARDLLASFTLRLCHS